MFCSCRISTDKCLARSLCHSRATCFQPWSSPFYGPENLSPNYFRKVCQRMFGTKDSSGVQDCIYCKIIRVNSLTKKRTHTGCCLEDSKRIVARPSLKPRLQNYTFISNQCKQADRLILSRIIMSHKLSFMLHF